MDGESDAWQGPHREETVKLLKALVIFGLLSYNAVLTGSWILGPLICFVPGFLIFGELPWVDNPVAQVRPGIEAQLDKMRMYLMNQIEAHLSAMKLDLTCDIRCVGNNLHDAVDAIKGSIKTMSSQSQAKDGSYESTQQHQKPVSQEPLVKTPRYRIGISSEQYIIVKYLRPDFTRSHNPYRCRVQSLSNKRKRFVLDFQRLTQCQDAHPSNHITFTAQGGRNQMNPRHSVRTQY